MANEYDVQKKGIAKFLDYLCLTPLGAIGFLILIIVPLFPPFNQDYLIRWFILAAIMGSGAMAFPATLRLSILDLPPLSV